MQAILTKYLPATNTRGSRIKASCERGSITISYDSALDSESAHIAAVDALVAKFVKEDANRYGTALNPWTGPRVCGGFGDGTMAHAFLPHCGADGEIIDWKSVGKGVFTA